MTLTRWGGVPDGAVVPESRKLCEVELPARHPSPAGAVNSDNWERRKGGRSAQRWDSEQPLGLRRLPRGGVARRAVWTQNTGACPEEEEEERGRLDSE